MLPDILSTVHLVSIGGSGTKWHGNHVGGTVSKQEERDPNEWTFTKRLALDVAEHTLRCVTCREKRRPGPREGVFGVKNKTTREFLHVIATDTAAARRALGWRDDDVLYTFDYRVSAGGPMSDETKAKLRAINEKNKAEKRALRGPEHPSHFQRPRKERRLMICTDCQAEFVRELRDGEMDPQQLRCVECQIPYDATMVEVEEYASAVAYENSKRKGTTKGVLTPEPERDILPKMSKTKVKAQETKSMQEGGETDMASLKEFVKEFIEGQVFDKKDGKLVFNSDSLFKLAKDNGLDVTKYQKGFKTENAGRIRMTVGNMIRGAAVRNRKLTTLGGASKLVPEALLPKPKEKKAKVAKKAKAKKAA